MLVHYLKTFQLYEHCALFWSFLLLLLGGVAVRSTVEVCEEREEHGPVGEGDGALRQREGARVVRQQQQRRAVQHHQETLQYLQHIYGTGSV